MILCITENLPESQFSGVKIQKKLKTKRLCDFFYKIALSVFRVSLMKYAPLSHFTEQAGSRFLLTLKSASGFSLSTDFTDSTDFISHI